MRRILAALLCLSFLILPVRAAETAKYVALTFDDGPSGKYTRRLLAGLEQRQVKATFLLCGYRLKDYPDTARAIFDGGHEIGLHGYSHDCMGCMSAERIEKELHDTLCLLPEGCKPVFLRPPGGKLNATVRQEAKSAGFAILTWSVDPRDWATSDRAAIVRSVTDCVRDGDVILMHDMSDSSVDAALEIIDILTERGFRFVTASELARIKSVTPEPGKVYCRF